MIFYPKEVFHDMEMMLSTFSMKYPIHTLLLVMISPLFQGLHDFNIKSMEKVLQK